MPDERPAALDRFTTSRLLGGGLILLLQGALGCAPRGLRQLPPARQRHAVFRTAAG